MIARGRGREGKGGKTVKVNSYTRKDGRCREK